MDGYKRIFRSSRIRIIILALLRILPDRLMLKLQYRIKFKRKLDLTDPKRFTEKIQWYKLFYRDPLMPVCSDKYAVRSYVRKKGYENILVDLYKVFKRPEDISFDDLPEKFVLKLSNGSGTNLLCRSKSSLDVRKVRRDFKSFLFKARANLGREWPYMKSEPVIVAERLLEDEGHENNAVNDYKIFCYSGKPKYIICISDRYSDKCNHLVYDTGWHKIPVASEGADLSADSPRPETLDEMLEIAGTLSEDFPFARVDLYSVSGKVFFGEITFFPWSGYMEFDPDDFDYELGKHFILPM